MRFSHLALVLQLFSTLLTAASPISNGVVISELGGQIQSQRPFTLSRFFAQGDIPHFAQARVAGKPVPTQCDVKTRWPDGSLQHAVLTFRADLPAKASLLVDFVDQNDGMNSGYMNKPAMLAASYFNAELALTDPEGKRHAANARQILSDWDGAEADLGIRYWLKGPICTQIILEDRGRAMAGGQRSFPYDMGWTTSWGGATYKERSLHPIFIVTFYPGWDGARVETVLENMWIDKLQDMTYSVEVRSGNPLASVYSKQDFRHSATTRWRKVAWSGARPGPVNVDYNFPYLVYSKALPAYDLSLHVSPKAISSLMQSYNRSDKGDLYTPGPSERHALWTKYMPTTGGRQDIGLLAAWYVQYLYTFDPALYHEGTYNGVAQEDTLLIRQAEAGAHWPVHYRESRAGRGFHLPQHEALGRSISINARPTVFFHWSGSGSAESDRVLPVGCQNQIYSAKPCLSITTKGGLAPDRAHQPDFAFLPYLITGDWYFLDEMYQWAAWNNASDNPAYRQTTAGTISDQSRAMAWAVRMLGNASLMAPDNSPEKAYFAEKLNNSTAAWEGRMGITDGAFYPDPKFRPLWEVGKSSYLPNPLGYIPTFTNVGVPCVQTTLRTPLSRDSTAIEVQDASRFKPGQKLLIDRELVRICSITGNLLDTQPVGKCQGSRGLQNTPAASHSAGAIVSFYDDSGVDPSKVSYVNSPWMDNYFHISLGRLSELGFKVDPFRLAILKNLLGQLTDPGYNPYLVVNYRMPMLTRAACTPAQRGTFFQTWSAVLDAYIDPGPRAFRANGSAMHGYGVIARAASSFMVDSLPGGEKAWNWLNTNLQTESMNDNPTWALVPRSWWIRNFLPQLQAVQSKNLARPNKVVQPGFRF